MKKITFEVCNCDATHKHGYFYIDGERASRAIYSTPRGQEVLAGIAMSEGLSDEDVALAKAQLEAADLAAEVLEHENLVAGMPPELAELMTILEGYLGPVIVVKI